MHPLCVCVCMHVEVVKEGEGRKEGEERMVVKEGRKVGRKECERSKEGAGRKGRKEDRVCVCVGGCECL